MSWLSKLAVERFRNLQKVELTLSSGCNLFIGPNGAGKTALLEAVHYAVRGRSFRTTQSSALIGHGLDGFLIRYSLHSDSGVEHQIGVERSRGQKQNVRWDGERGSFGRSSAMLPMQVIQPMASELVFGGPSERRRWLDWGAFHVEHSYLREWRAYMKALRQRNAYLKQLGKGSEEARLLESYSSQYLSYADRVDGLRRQFLEIWRPVFASYLETLLGDLSAEIDARFNPFGSSKSASLQDLSSEAGEREVKLGASAYGPHRADLEFSLGPSPLREVASRGQGKLVALALLLSQAALIAQRRQQRSVFLLDDIFSELDPRSLERLLVAIEDTGGQLFVTAPSVVAVPERLKRLRDREPAVFHVEQGQVTRETSD